MERIKPRVKTLLNMSEEEFEKEIVKFARSIGGFRAVLEDYLLETLEKPSGIKKSRLIAIANHLNFTSQCLVDIKNRNPKISAMGARKAGLYHLEEAADDMLRCLDFVTSENQFEILVAFARVGKA
jgi:hypothetical protein